MEGDGEGGGRRDLDALGFGGGGPGVEGGPRRKARGGGR